MRIQHVAIKHFWSGKPAEAYMLQNESFFHWHVENSVQQLPAGSAAQQSAAVTSTIVKLSWQ